MKKIFIFLFSFLLISCGDNYRLPFNGEGFGGPQNADEDLKEKVISNTPVVFLHGNLSTASYWRNARKYFLKNGYNPHELFAITLSRQGLADLYPGAKELDIFIKNVLKYTQKEKVHLIAISKGGPIARIYLKNFKGNKYVSKCVLLASPNHGATGASGIFSPAGDFVRNLNTPSETLPGVSYLCIASTIDHFFGHGLLRSPFLKGAKNIMLKDIPHIELGTTNKVFNIILKFLAFDNT